MKTEFDTAYWSQKIKEPDWYIEMADSMRKARKLLKDKPDELSKISKKARLFFEQALEKDEVNLGKSGNDFDVERRPIDKVVIHHTSAEPGYRLSYMSATQLLNLYAMYYSDPTEEEKEIKGQPIWSGHFRNGKQVFFAYHWLMRMDGSFERLLNDDEIGWQAGKWDVNCRSVAICLDNDYEKQDPDDRILDKWLLTSKISIPKSRKQTY